MPKLDFTNTTIKSVTVQRETLRRWYQETLAKPDELQENRNMALAVKELFEVYDEHNGRRNNTDTN